jgi:hypothetical protein
MLQKITGFFKDAENRWGAKLMCGHTQTLTGISEPLANRFGEDCNCTRCDEVGFAIARALLKEARAEILQSYEDAGLSGLCDEGRIEAALGALETLPIKDIIEKALKP